MCFQVKELTYYPLPCGAFASIWDDPPSTDGGFLLDDEVNPSFKNGETRKTHQ